MTLGNSKRDLNLIRQILIDLEEGKASDYSDYDSDQVLYNKWLILDAGMAIGSPQISDDLITTVILIRLTWKGCEFLDAARDPTIWKSVWERVANAGGSVTIAVLINLLNQAINMKLGMP